MNSSSGAPGWFDKRMHGYTSLAVWLFGALALIVPSGYSLGALLLLLGSIVLLVSANKSAPTPPSPYLTH